jgi:hypothetical protein
VKSLLPLIGCRLPPKALDKHKIDGLQLLSFEDIIDLLAFVDARPSDSVEWLRLYSCVKHIIVSNEIESMDDIRLFVREKHPDLVPVLLDRFRFTMQMLLELDIGYYTHVLHVGIARLRTVKGDAQALSSRRTFSSV